MTEDNEQGFTVSDRRQSRDRKPDSAAPPPPAGPDAPTEEIGDAPAGEADLPPLDFISFVLSLASSVLIHLGEAPDPMTGEQGSQPALAKQTIDILSILEEKTRGNLDRDEERILGSVLGDLRVRYLKAVDFIK
jgi:hypothetical protein